MSPDEVERLRQMQKVPHHLPFEPGRKVMVSQGNEQGPTHDTIYNLWAFDFDVPVGTPVHATADGVVVFLRVGTEGPTGNMDDNNEIGLKHDDGTFATYAHLRKDGAVVVMGDRVLAGDLIGYSGNTGASTRPHLHFNLRRGHPRGPCIPCRFSDVEGDGVPETGDWVESNNVLSRDVVGTMLGLQDLLALCGDLQAPVALTEILGELRKSGLPREVRSRLARLEDREDLQERCEAIGRELLAAAEAQCEARSKAIEAAQQAGEVALAVRAAVFGEEDFEALGRRADFRKAHDPLRQAEGYSEALKELRPWRAARRAFGRAVQRQLDAEAAARKGKRVDWSKVVKEYQRAREEWPDEAQAERLSQQIAKLEALVEKSPDAP